jgi:DNA excision repair protein ERCC-2
LWKKSTFTSRGTGRATSEAGLEARSIIPLVKTELRVSVRGLVGHSLRSGDLDLESYGGSSPLDAIRAHQKLQASRPEGYRKEVSVAGRFEREDFVLEVQGRIDGVWERAEGPLVEEIKTTRGDLGHAAAAEKPTHWGQLQVYAFFYARERGLETVDTRLTYYQLDTGETLEVDRRFARAELEDAVETLVSRYLDWMARVFSWIRCRNETIAAATFPFPSFRPGQREMAVAVYRAVLGKSDVLAQAPTGIGKTQAALFPAVKALGEGACERIFYLTARTTGRRLAEKALAELRLKGARLRATTLTAKDKICFNPEKACNGAECEFARGFYDRLDAALGEALELQEMSREAVEALARKHRLCPFELSLSVARWSDVVIGDYNYVFDPRVYLRRFFDEDGSTSTLLVDEAHNLLDRAREMFSAELSSAEFSALFRLPVVKARPPLLRSLRRVRAAFRELREGARAAGGSYSGDSPPTGLLGPLERFVREVERALVPGALASGAEKRLVLNGLFASTWFAKIADRWDDGYTTCYEANGREVRVKLFCRDPAPRLAERFKTVRSSILFSATLTPPGYFRRTLGLTSEALAIRLDSPFPRENLRVLLATGIATTYRRRVETEGDVTRALSEFVRSRHGNYLVYFSSYEYLEAIRRRFANDCPEVALAVQTREMAEEEREAFLARFEPGGELVGFAVLGGFFGEGIDLPGERLEGVAIVGVGLPALSPERDRLRDYFEREERAGFEYAYLFPGMTRVLQAAGRVIRSETDRGAVLLVDQRFRERRYRSLFPPDWIPLQVYGPTEIRRELEHFWLGSRHDLPP